MVWNGEAVRGGENGQLLVLLTARAQTVGIVTDHSDRPIPRRQTRPHVTTRKVAREVTDIGDINEVTERG